MYNSYRGSVSTAPCTQYTPTGNKTDTVDWRKLGYVTPIKNQVSLSLGHIFNLYTQQSKVVLSRNKSSNEYCVFTVQCTCCLEDWS